MAKLLNTASVRPQKNRGDDGGKNNDVASLHSVEDNKEADDVNRESMRSLQSNSENEEVEQEVVERPSYNVEDAINRANDKDPSLTTIDLCDQYIDDARLADLASALFNNTHVTTLDLQGHWGIGPDVVVALATMLRRNKTLRELKLGDCDIGVDGVRTLASALQENATLQRLEVNRNRIGDDGAASVAAALRENSSLRILRLDSNRIGDDGVSSLAEALLENTALHSLYLDYNDIGDDGAARLAKVLRENDTLRTLHLDHTRIGDDGASSLAEGLPENTTLWTLNLRFTDVRDEGAASFASALEVNTTLTSLYLDFYDGAIEDQSLNKKISGILARNQEIIRINERKKSLREHHDMLSAKGLVDALVELNNDKDIFESVVFLLLQEMPEVLDRFYFKGAK